LFAGTFSIAALIVFTSPDPSAATVIEHAASIETAETITNNAAKITTRITDTLKNPFFDVGKLTSVREKMRRTSYCKQDRSCDAFFKPAFPGAD